MKKILFVCTGNICRSPMADWYLRKRVKELDLTEFFKIDSCGTYAINGEKASFNAIATMKRYDVDLENHLAKNIAEIDIDNVDLIITMTLKHKEFIKYKYPNVSTKVFTLVEYVDRNNNYLDIDDPWGYDNVIFDNIADQIVEKVEKLIFLLQRE